MTLNAKIEGFMDFLAISGCDTSLYHSQGSVTLIDRNSSHVRRKKSGEPLRAEGQIVPTQIDFQETIFRPLGGADPQILHMWENDQVLLAQTPLGIGSPLQFFSKGGQKLV